MSNYLASVQDVNFPLAYDPSFITHRVLHIVASWQLGLHRTVHGPELPIDTGHYWGVSDLAPSADDPFALHTHQLQQASFKSVAHVRTQAKIWSLQVIAE